MPRACTDETKPKGEPPFDRRWKFPVIPSVIRRTFERPAPADLDRLRKHYVPDVSDAVGRMYTVQGVTSFYSPAIRITGPALTVKCPPGDNLAVRVALMMVEPGDILVVDAQGFSEWCLGGFQMLSRAIQERGLAGLIVHGAYRDATEARRSGFPIYAKASAIWSGPKIAAGEVNVPVCCGGVIVNPGDAITASEEGIAVVPRQYLGLVLDHLDMHEASPQEAKLAQITRQDELIELYLAEIEKNGRLDYLE